jgi:anti-sigma factor RsiW
VRLRWKRGDLAPSSWSRDGRGYLVIGRLSEAQVAELAQTLKARFLTHLRRAGAPKPPTA